MESNLSIIKLDSNTKLWLQIQQASKTTNATISISSRPTVWSVLSTFTDEIGLQSVA